MEQFKIVPQIKVFDTFAAYCLESPIGEQDLVFADGFVYQRFQKELESAGAVVDFSTYPAGEPTDLLVEAIYEATKHVSYERIIGIGGGTVLDVAKLFSLEQVHPVTELFLKKFEAKRTKRLVLIPTTCGTGSEVTNISILELTTIHSKFGLAIDELFASEAVLIPQMIQQLPMKFFATSSIDALIHAVESYTSPKANAFTRLYSEQAMRLIIKGYQAIAQQGETARLSYLKEFMIASNFAGIAFGNAGCAAVHAMSYPLGAAHHVPHGESNYVIFAGVYKTYNRLQPEGAIHDLNCLLADLLGCGEAAVYDRLEDLLGHILVKKPLRDYGVTPEELDVFTETVMTKQQRLMANNYVPLDAETVKSIYQELY